MLKFSKFINSRKSIKKKKGLTLLEILAVIVIMGIVAAVSVPAIMNYIGDSEVKSFKQELSTLETVMVNKRAVSTELDYAKFGTTKLDVAKVEDYVKSEKPLPIADASKPDTAYVELTITGGAALSTTGTIPATGTVSKNGTGTLPVSLAEQLGSLYLTDLGQVVKIKAYPIDVEFLYAGKLVTNQIAFPKNITTTLKGYGKKYQDKTSGSTFTPAVNFPTEPNKGGSFLLLDNGKVVYTGTDAKTSDDKYIHIATK